MAYSVQQIKFELISHVKEFGGDFTQWSVGTAEDAPKCMFQLHGVNPAADIWVWKPALTSAAAEMVVAWMSQRQNAKAVSGDPQGNCVFMFRKAAGDENER